jgi:hypothetical protein
LFRALGNSDPPSCIEIDGRQYLLVEKFKHDSWAATALYAGFDGKIVCKFNRQYPIFGVPMTWLGRFLARREDSLMRQLLDVPSIPTPCGPVSVRGVAQPHAVAHRYVEGRPLQRGEEVASDLFPALRNVLRTMHNRGVAYVDLHKCENIIVGDDGRPHLIDFQISFSLSSGRLGRCWPLQAIFRILANSDEYHLRKHVLAAEGKELTPQQREDAVNRPWWIRLHRMIAVPLRSVRRRLLVALRVRSVEGTVASEWEPEHAVRHERHFPATASILTKKAA